MISTAVTVLPMFYPLNSSKGSILEPFLKLIPYHALLGLLILEE